MTGVLLAAQLRLPIAGWANVFCPIPPPARNPNTQPAGLPVRLAPRNEHGSKLELKSVIENLHDGYSDSLQAE